MEGALPSSACMAANTHALGRYAALCQEQGLVPIVEPEVLMDGSHTIERCEEVSRGRKPLIAGRAASLGRYTDEMETASQSADDPPHRHDWRDD
jgi:fructose-bisphosphate aldolase class 1